MEYTEQQNDYNNRYCLFIYVEIRTNRNASVVMGKLGVLPSLGSFLLDINDDKKDE